MNECNYVNQWMSILVIKSVKMNDWMILRINIDFDTSTECKSSNCAHEEHVHNNTVKNDWRNELNEWLNHRGFKDVYL